MSSASPFLDTLLTHWGQCTSDVRLAHAKVVDDLLADRKALDDSREALWRMATHDWYALERYAEHQGRQSAEHLQQIETLKSTLARFSEEALNVGAVVEAGYWFNRADSLAAPLTRHLSALADKLSAAHQELELRLVIWQELLDAKEAEMKTFKEKEGSQNAALLVSRARKQIELDFLETQGVAEREIGTLMQAARRQLHYAMNRLYKASNALERRSATHPPLYEARKNRISDILEEAHDRLFALRENILSDALDYETCRRKLRWVQTTVQSIRCLEDVYKAPEPLWKKLLR